MGDPVDVRHIGLVNANSLVNKLGFISALLQEENVTLLAVCETWLVESVPSSFVDIVGYNFFRCDVTGQIRKHGVGLYLRKEVEGVQVEVGLPNVVVVSVPNWNMHIVAVYRPPSNSDVLNEELSRFIRKFLS